MSAMIPSPDANSIGVNGRESYTIKPSNLIKDVSRIRKGAASAARCPCWTPQGVVEPEAAPRNHPGKDPLLKNEAERRVAANYRHSPAEIIMRSEAPQVPAPHCEDAE